MDSRTDSHFLKKRYLIPAFFGCGLLSYCIYNYCVLSSSAEVDARSDDAEVDVDVEDVKRDDVPMDVRDLPHNLKSLKMFTLTETLVQTADYNTFLGHFGDVNKPAIIAVRIRKPTAADLGRWLFTAAANKNGQNNNNNNNNKNGNNRQTKKKKKKGKKNKKNKRGGSWDYGNVVCAHRLEESPDASGTGFAQYACFFTGDLFSSLHISVIYPWEDRNVTEAVQSKIFAKHLRKHKPRRFVMVLETPELYAAVTKPAIIDKTPLAHCQWVYDILDGHKEQKRIIYADNDAQFGFVSVIDSKWRSHCNVHQFAQREWKEQMPAANIARSLYVLCIVRDASLRSLRDLNGAHIQMLENISERTSQTIEDIYGLQAAQMRVFIHYFPQYFHFHVHFASVGFEGGVDAGKGHLLTTVIANLKMNANYYQEIALECRVSADHPLCQ